MVTLRDRSRHPSCLQAWHGAHARMHADRPASAGQPCSAGVPNAACSSRCATCTLAQSRRMHSPGGGRTGKASSSRADLPDVHGWPEVHAERQAGAVRHGAGHVVPVPQVLQRERFPSQGRVPAQRAQLRSRGRVPSRKGGGRAVSGSQANTQRWRPARSTAVCLQAWTAAVLHSSAQHTRPPAGTCSAAHRVPRPAAAPAALARVPTTSRHPTWLACMQKLTPVATVGDPTNTTGRLMHRPPRGRAPKGA